MLAVVALGTGAVTLGQDVEDEGITPAPLADREVFGFLPYWELDADQSIDLGTVTTIAWFGLEAGVDGRLIRETADAEPTPGWAILGALVAFLSNPDAKVVAFVHAETSTGAAVVVCPGGGYGVVAADHEGKQVADKTRVH